jgi:predicted Rossmann fold flavoprotein
MMFDVIIIGGGPAGLMAAIELEASHVEYVLLEKNEQVGKKLLLTGGKRCNVTNHLEVDQFIEQISSNKRRFLYPSITAFSPNDIVAFFTNNDVPLVLENDFKYFPKSNQSSSILTALTNLINKKRIKYNEHVDSIEKIENEFTIKTLKHNYKTKNVILATGSNSFPSTGSSGDGIKLVKTFELETVPFTPAETHIYFSDVSRFKILQGISVQDATVQIKQTKIKFTGDLLFTHFGLSGPVIYHLSEYIYDALLDGKNELMISFTDHTYEQIMTALSSDRTVLQTLRSYLPKRLAALMINEMQLQSLYNKYLTKHQKELIFQSLTRFTVLIKSVEDKTKAYVNRGGIDLSEINPKSMEVKKVAGLYIAGETLNIHGPVGGYNITIALATGKCAAKNIVKKINKANSL